MSEILIESEMLLVKNISLENDPQPRTKSQLKRWKNAQAHFNFHRSNAKLVSLDQKKYSGRYSHIAF